MRINQIIREKRKKLSLTQEQIAEYLGVSTPAVNKWEKRPYISRYHIVACFSPLIKNRFEYANVLP